MEAGVARFCFFSASKKGRLLNGIWKSEQESKLLGLFEKNLSVQGYRVVDLDVRLASRSLVRLFIDKAESDKGVSVEDCAKVTRLIEPLVDGEIHGQYELEVSSPGLDRRLRLREDFEKAAGEPVTIKLHGEVQGVGKTVHGVLKSVATDAIELANEGKEFTIPLDQIRQANLKR